MASEDSFITEVSEEVRRDKLFALLRKYGWIAILAVILIVGGATWNEWRKARLEAAAQAQGDAIIDALRAETPEARIAGLGEVPASEDPGGRAVLGLLQAAAAEDAGDRAGAASALDAVISDGEVPMIYRDVARLKRIVTAGDGLSPSEKIERLGPILAAGNRFRLLAVEQKALAEIESGDTDAALATLESILEDAEVTEDLRRRAQQLSVALGGSVAPG